MLVLVLLVVVPVALVLVFVPHAHDCGFGLLDLALRLRREHEQRCRIPERHERLAYRLALRIVLRGVLESDHVHRGDSKLDHQLLAFDDDVERSVSVLMGVMLAALAVRRRKCGTRQEGGGKRRRGPHPARKIQSLNDIHLMFSARSGHVAPTSRRGRETL